MEDFELFNLDSTELYECISSAKIKLKNTNANYKELYRKLEKIKDKFPNIRGILEDEQHSELTLEESENLLKVINLYRDILEMEQYEIFFLGGKETYNFFKKIDILK